MTAADDVRPSILVVEDEWIIAELIAVTLQDDGYEVIGPVGSVAEAMRLIKVGHVRAALLDVCLGSEQSFPIADELLATNVPFAFMTGFGAVDLPPKYRGFATLGKPIAPGELVKALRRLLGATSEQGSA